MGYTHGSFVDEFVENRYDDGVHGTGVCSLLDTWIELFWKYS
jgi:hypothetical protein